MKKKKNLLVDDPTRTLTLRNRAVKNINGKFNEIIALITKSIVHNKIFTNANDPLQKTEFVYLRDDEKLKKFDAWLFKLINQKILSGSSIVTSNDINWLISYFHESYERGATKTNNELATILGRNAVPSIVSFWNTPMHVEKSALIFSRNFEQLKGVTETMSQQISYELSQGILRGDSPYTIARNINNRVNKIGKTRSRLLARTEIINSHNLGAIMEGQRIEAIIGEEIVYHWITAGDIKVRDDHITRDGKYYSASKVSTLIGEPNCRCRVQAVPVSQLNKKQKIIR